MAFTWVFKFKKAAFILFIIFFSFFIYGFLSRDVSLSDTKKLFGRSILFLATWLIFQIAEAFFNFRKEKHPGVLSFEVAKAVQKSAEDTTKLFYYLISDNRNLNFIFSRALLSVKETKQILKNYSGPQGRFDEFLVKAQKIAQEKKHQKIEEGDAIAALAETCPAFKKILIDSNLKTQDVENLSYWLEYLERKIAERKRFWDWKNLIKAGSLAKEWTSGHTITLDRFSRDISGLVKKQGFPSIMGHEKEKEAIERILARREKNNVLLVGEPGSGRKSIVQALAVKSSLGESFPEVNYQRFLQLDLTSLSAQFGNPEEANSVLDKIFKEALSSGNVILVIDELHNFIGIANSLAPYLALPKFQIIGITTFEGLHRRLEQNASLLSLFEKVEVQEVSERETLMLLENLALELETRHRLFISYPALRDIIGYCAKYLADSPFPEKALKLLDEAVVFAVQQKEKALLPKHIASIVAEKTQIPVGDLEAKEKQVLLNLEELIHQRLINQEEAVKEVSSALRRARAEISLRKGLIGSFLFLGPTGVGKTETAKALAQIYFGAEDRMIRLDMSEFQNTEDVTRLIGSVKEEGLLTTRVRERPFSLILLDEIEKAHQNILNLFLQVLDEGHLTDGLGRKVDFKNTMVIATSNAGYQIILEAIKENSEWLKVKEKLLNFIFEKGIFRPEFINRFDGVVVFGPLSKENLLGVAELQLKKLKKSLAEKEIELIISQLLKEKIVELGYDPTFGARFMQRVIQDKISNVLATAILSGQLKRGDKVEINPEDFSLKIN